MDKRTITMRRVTALGIQTERENYWHPCLHDRIGTYVYTTWPLLDLATDRLVVLDSDCNKICEATPLRSVADLLPPMMFVPAATSPGGAEEAVGQALRAEAPDDGR